MIQVRLLNGPQAGAEWIAARLPVTVGRASSADIRIEYQGVWDRHLEIERTREGRLQWMSHPDTFAVRDGEKTREAVMKNGEVLELGAAKIRLGLSPVRHRGLAFREAVCWAGFCLLILFQTWVLRWLTSH